MKPKEPPWVVVDGQATSVDLGQPTAVAPPAAVDADEKPTAVDLPRPAADADEKPTAVGLPRPAADADEKPTAVDLPRPAADAAEKPTSVDLPRPAADADEKPTSVDLPRPARHQVEPDQPSTAKILPPVAEERPVERDLTPVAAHRFEKPARAPVRHPAAAAHDASRPEARPDGNRSDARGAEARRRLRWRLGAALFIIAVAAITVATQVWQTPEPRPPPSPPTPLVMPGRHYDWSSSSGTLTPPGAGVVSITVEPVKAAVTIDGKLLGDSPVKAVVPLGRVKVLLENAALGCRQTVELDVRGDVAVRLPLRMGWVDITAPDGSRLFVDGKAAPGALMEVCEGTHQVEAVFPDGNRKTGTAQVLGQHTTSVELLPPSPTSP